MDGPAGAKGKRQPIRAREGESTAAATAIILGQGRERARYSAHPFFLGKTGAQRLMEMEQSIVSTFA